jgi:hypothetical protein
MVMQLRVAGFQVEGRPFGHFPIERPDNRLKFESVNAPERGFSAWLRDLGRYVFGSSKSSG